VKVSKRFLIVFFAIFTLLNIVVGLLWVSWNYPVTILYFVIIEWINIGVSFSLTEFVFTILLKPQYPPQISRLTSSPRVAVLYTTCDDVIPELIARLGQQSYRPCDVFILDDSEDEEIMSLIDETAAQYRYQVIRRTGRKGYKAGNLNNWLFTYGEGYDYFVILDSDSILSPHFVESMLRYAEHQRNAQVALFQSRIWPWNAHSGAIPEAIAALTPLTMFQLDRLTNQCDFLPAWGHNNLCRVQAFLRIGGFDERFLSEDFAAALDLISAGYGCRLVAVDSYEAVPQTVTQYWRRTRRWAQQSLQLEFCRASTDEIPLMTKLYTFMNSYQYLSWLFYLPAMVLVIWSYESNLNDVTRFLQLIISPELVSTPIFGPLLLVAFYIMTAFLLRLPLALNLGISPTQYFRHLAILWSLSFSMMFHLLMDTLAFFVGIRPTFTVTGRRPVQLSGRQSFLQIVPLTLFVGVMIIGCIRNPMALTLNLPWLLPLISSPLVYLSLSSNDSSNSPAGQLNRKERRCLDELTADYG